jgi:hypothetical protein
LLLGLLPVFSGLYLSKTYWSLTSCRTATAANLHGPSVLFDILYAITIVDMIQKLAIGVAIRASRAFELQDVHKVL